MKRKGKESKLNVALTSLLVVFVCLLSFSIGVISGKGWSDRDHHVKFMTKDDHVKAAEEDTEPLGEEMTDKEVKLLTDRALKEAEAQQPTVKPQEPEETSMLDQMESEVDSSPKSNTAKPVTAETPKATDRKVASDDGDDDDEDDDEDEDPKGRDASTAKTQTPPAQAREVSSLMPKPTTPKPTAVDYTVQVAAYKTIEEAENHSQKLIDKGFPAFPVKAMINGAEWYRVSIGSFKTKTQAMNYEKELKKQAVVKNTLVQKIERLEK